MMMGYWDHAPPSGSSHTFRYHFASLEHDFASNSTPFTCPVYEGNATATVRCSFHMSSYSLAWMCVVAGTDCRLQFLIHGKPWPCDSSPGPSLLSQYSAFTHKACLKASNTRDHDHEPFCWSKSFPKLFPMHQRTLLSYLTCKSGFDAALIE